MSTATSIEKEAVNRNGQIYIVYSGRFGKFAKNVLGLLEQIKDAGLTVQEAYFVLDQAKRDIKDQVMRSLAVT